MNQSVRTALKLIIGSATVVVLTSGGNFSLLPNSVYGLSPQAVRNSFFDPVVSAVAFVYLACSGHCPGHSVVRAAGAKCSSDREDHVVIGLAPLQDSPVPTVSPLTTITRKTLSDFTPTIRRYLRFASRR